MNVKFFTIISLNMMKNYLHFDLMQKLNNCLVNDRALGDSFQSFQTAFTSAFVRLDEVLQPSRKSLLTPEIQRVDNERVKLWRVVKNFAKEQETMPSQAVSTAAGFVSSLIHNHGDVPNMKVTERTGALTNLCQDLTVRYAAQVAALGLTSFAAQLSEANAEYLRLYEQRLHDWSEFNDGEIKAARTAIDTALENLLIMVASGILTRGMAEYKHFVDYANEAIKVAKIAMGVPTTKPEGGEAATPGEEETTPPSTEPSEPETPEPTNPGEPGTNEPTTPNEPSNPGNGGDNNGGGSTEGEPLYTIAWYDKSTPIQWYELPAGAPVPEAPEPPAGHRWAQTFTVMPARDVDIVAVAI